MGIISVCRQGHQQRLTCDENGVIGAVEYFVAEFTTDVDGTAALNVSTGDLEHTMPMRGSIHPTLSGIVCRRYEYVPADNNTRRTYICRAEYDDNFTFSSPLLAPADIQWDFTESGQEPYFIDFDPSGPKPVLNTAKDRFADYLQRVGGEITVKWSKNIDPSAWTAIAAASAATYYKAINSDTFTVDGVSLTQYQARCAGISCGPLQKENGIQYRVKSITLKLKPDWRQVVDSRGPRYLRHWNGADNWMPCPSLPPENSNANWPLKSDGTPCANVTDTPASLTFYPYQLAAFSGLGLT
jgi:hypothetical protein